MYKRQAERIHLIPFSGIFTVIRNKNQNEILMDRTHLSCQLHAIDITLSLIHI